MIRALVLIAAFASIAHAEVIALPKTKATIDLPTTWTKVETVGLVLGAKGPASEILAVTRAQVPNPDAWRSKKRDAYIDQIEKGIAAKIKGYKRVTKKLAQVETIPTLDIEARREDGATLLVRVLLYRTYALSLAIEVPKRASLKEARAIVVSFSPPVLEAHGVEP